METGVGKTYTYIKTMYELNKHYGWSKFIVVVPSIAIREGVYKSFQVTQDHFAEEYGKKIRFFIYNSAQLTEIDRFASDRTHLSKYWQDGFFEYMHEQYSQLERGEPAAETKRKHIPVWLYKKGEHLDRMYGQVKEILDNIGILNAKGKSKEALELLRQWSKEGEYFSSKIKEVTGHIDGLNAEVNKWQSKYNSERRMVEQMSDYNKAANSTIEEQEYEIGRLIRQNDRYRELLDRIPDEIYEEITNTRSKNRDRGER